MSDAAKLLVAMPLMLLAGLAVGAIVQSQAACKRAVRRIRGHEHGDLPFLLRQNHGNVIFYPHLLDPAGLAERRRALWWQALYLGAIGAAIVYVSWVRSLAE